MSSSVLHVSCSLYIIIIEIIIAEEEIMPPNRSFNFQNILQCSVAKTLHILTKATTKASHIHKSLYYTSI